MRQNDHDERNARRAPLYEMLKQHARGESTAFHIPGHKQRAQWGDEDADSRYRSLLPLDVTELASTDDLHHPTGPIIQAQQLAADCFGAEETRFLVGGSTAGNLAMVLGTTSPGDLLIVQRNVHRSIFHGLMLAGVRAVLLQPEIDARSGLAISPTVDQVQEAVQRYPQARGVIVCSPNYYGMCGDLTRMAQICHRAGIPLMVDEAHGPHFGLHTQFPASALQAGADIVVQSTHKMLGSMTMSAMLHMQGERVDREAVRQALRMVQSTSPSFPLLATLDLARYQVHAAGESAFAPALTAAARIREQLPHTVFREPEYGDNDKEGRPRKDPLKLVLYDAGGKRDGFRLRDELVAQGCLPEMADAKYVVLALGVGTTMQDADHLLETLLTLSAGQQPNKAAPRQQAMHSNGRLDAALQTPEPIMFSRVHPRTARIRLSESIGKIAGEWVVPYPPGIPELFPGEPITQLAVDRLHNWKRQGALIQGVEDESLEWIRIVVTSAEAEEDLNEGNRP